MPATLTRKPKSKKKTPKTTSKKQAKRAAKAPRPSKPAKVAPVSIEDQRAIVAQIEKKIADADPYVLRREIRDDKLNAELIAARSKLERMELASMPLPTGIGCDFTEDDVKVDAIVITGNHRDYTEHADPETERLARSMKTVGLSQRVGVARYDGDAKWKGKFELIWGSRRFAAGKLNDWTKIPAKIFDNPTPFQVELLRTSENFDHKGLSPAEQALAVARMIDSVEQTIKEGDFKNDDKFANWLTSIDAMGGAASRVDEHTGVRQIGPGITAYVAQVLGQPASWVRDRVYVQRLTPASRALLAGGRIDLGHARELARIADPDAMDGFAASAARALDGTGGATAIELSKRIAGSLRSLKSVPWRLEVAFGRDARSGCEGWACATCPHNSNADPTLFEGAGVDLGELGRDAGVCLNESCFESKKHTTEKLIQVGVTKVREWVKKLNKDERPESLSATVLDKAELIPEPVKSATFVRRVQKEIAPETGAMPTEAKEKKERAAMRSSDVEKLPASELARRAWASKVDEWQRQSADQIAKAAAKSDKRMFAMMVTLQLTNTIDRLTRSESTHYYGRDIAGDIARDRKHDEQVAAVVAGKELSLILSLLKEPTLDGLVALVKKAKTEIESYRLEDLHPDALKAIAETLGVKVGEPPARPADEATPVEAASSEPEVAEDEDDEGDDDDDDE